MENEGNTVQVNQPVKIDNFIGNFILVDINSVVPNDWNPKDSIEESDYNRQRYEEIKANIAKKGIYEPIKVREVGDGKFEILDGYHRWRACVELGYTRIPVWNLGRVSREYGQGITLDSEYLKVPASEIRVAQLIKSMLEVNHQAVEYTPFTPNKIEEYQQMAQHDWGKPPSSNSNGNGQGNSNQKEPQEITCPECGHQWTI